MATECPDSLKQIREEAVQALTESERKELADIIESSSEIQPPAPEYSSFLFENGSSQDIDEILADGGLDNEFATRAGII